MGNETFKGRIQPDDVLLGSDLLHIKTRLFPRQNQFRQDSTAVNSLLQFRPKILKMQFKTLAAALALFISVGAALPSEGKALNPKTGLPTKVVKPKLTQG